MRSKTTHLVRLACGVGIAAALLAGHAPARGQTGDASASPHVFVHLQDGTGAAVPGGCFAFYDDPPGEAVYGELCDGSDYLFRGDGVADGTVAFEFPPDPGNYILYTVLLPEPYEEPSDYPAPVPFTVGTSDVHLTVTLPDHDATPPVLSLPGDLVVDASSPSGAEVAYSATATDSQGNPLAASCNPAPSSTFPIGTTAVSCTATDSGGRTSSGVFTVTVRGAGAQLEDLLQRVQGVGPGRSLEAKVRTAQAALEVGDVAGACSALANFIDHVNRHAGKSVTTAQAQELTATATRIAAVIGCP